MTTRFALLLIPLLVPAATSAQPSGSTISNARILEATAVEAGDTVCEMGAGDGELSIAAARAVGAGGRVYTSELGESRVETLRRNVGKSGLSHITVVEGAAAETNFPDEACDAVFMRNVYHHFEEPVAMNASIAAALKPGGHVVIVDFAPNSGEDAARPSDRDTDPTHGVKAESVARELTEAGFKVSPPESGASRWYLVAATKP